MQRPRKCLTWGSAPERGLCSDFHAYLLHAERANPHAGRQIVSHLDVAVYQIHNERRSEAYTCSD
jgi:hypothetical protein